MRVKRNVARVFLFLLFFFRGLRASRGCYRANYQILSLPCNDFLPEVDVETRVAALVATSLAICFNYQLEDSQRSFVSLFSLSLSLCLLLFLSLHFSLFLFQSRLPRDNRRIINLEILSFESVVYFISSEV